MSLSPRSSDAVFGKTQSARIALATGSQRPWANSPRLILLTVLTCLPVVSFVASHAQAPPSSPPKDMNDTSVMLKPWPGQFGGVPPWDAVRVDEFVGAIESAIRAEQKEIEAIASNPAPATFENTILALEAAGETLDRVETLLDVHTSGLSLGPIPDIERVVAPQLSQHADSIVQNRQLFARIEAVYHGEELQSAPAAQQRLVEELYRSFVRRGAQLDDDEQAELSRINMRLASLFTDFNQHVLEDEKRFVTWIDDPADLAGLPDSTIAALAAAATQRDSAGGRWAVTNTRSSVDPFLTNADHRGLREQVWRNFYSRCDHGDEFDNNAVIREILNLRLARAKLLGYATHADWRMQRTMAGTPDAAMALMMEVWPKAVARVAEEVADMQRVADREAELGGREPIRIEAWDYLYYAEKVRQEKYELDFNQVEPYLQLEKLTEAMMWVGQEVFELRFAPAPDVPVYHPDVRVWQVNDREGGHVGLFYLDPYARQGKRSGAWMSEYRPQRRLPTIQSPIVSNNSNFVKPSSDQPALISWDDATTLFHEFGHALHGLLSAVDYPSQAGTRVVRDYVEFPSQILEHWLPTDEVLQRFALHHQTGEPLPPELVTKILEASKFNQGFATVEYLASAIVDMKLHMLDQVDIDPAEFERQTLAAIGMPREMVMRHRLPHFSHLFSSDSYSAGYYSYLWSDALTADAAEAFEQAPGGYFDRDLANKLRTRVFSVGDTIDAGESFRQFRGRDVDTSALLRKRGFPVADSQ